MINIKKFSKHSKKWKLFSKDSVIKDEWSHSRFAVLIHVYYEDLIGEIIEHLGVLPPNFDLFISVAEHLDFDACLSQFEKLGAGNIYWIRVRNRGRDIYPFLLWISSPHYDLYDFFLKIHTKRSAWIENSPNVPIGVHNGEEWRKIMLQNLLPNSTQVMHYIVALGSKNQIGVITPKRSNLNLQEFIGGNSKTIKQITKKLSVPINADCTFPAGSMYWAKCSSLQPLNRHKPRLRFFEKETGQYDGTYAHGVERIIGILVNNNYYKIVETTYF
jgi:lipopolysaccharide biosynthesis protein